MIQRKLITTRKAKGFTQKKLAELIGVEQTTLSRKEKGLSPISPDEWERISKILDTPVQDIIEEWETTVSPTQVSAFKNQSDKNDYITLPKDVFEQLLKSKDEQISLLKSILEKN